MSQIVWPSTRPRRLDFRPAPIWNSLHVLRELVVAVGVCSRITSGRQPRF